MKSLRVDSLVQRCMIEEKEKWRDWIEKIPFIQFKPDWKVQIIPPTVGAMARFRVLKPDCKEEISIYLDCLERLGHFGGPYWEVYPHRGDVARCSIEDVDTLIQYIEEAGDGKSNDAQII